MISDMMINWSPKTIWTGDCVEIMRGMNSESVDLIYLDPPFNSNANYAAPIGSPAAGAAFKDTWTLTDIDVEWVNLIEEKHPALNRLLLAVLNDSDKAYLIYMTARILEMYRVLKPTGSIYLHCDPTMSHYLKLIMDVIFGRAQQRKHSRFRNEIVWHYYNGSNSSHREFGWKHDVILFYSKSAESYTYNWDAMREPYPEGSNYAKGTRYNKKGFLKGNPDGKLLHDVWRIPSINNMSKERTGYPTQKPLALLRRIIQASSREGDVVLDPFCGCATTCVAAEELGRTWAGIDISPKAAELVVRRIEDQQGLWRDIVHRTDIPKRTDLGAIPPYNSKENKERLYGSQGGDCAGCGTHFMKQHLEVDHIIAQSKGGTDHIDNLQLMCANCNRIKGDRGMDYLRTKLELT